MHCDGYLEMQMVRALDFDDNVDTFVTQPFTIKVAETWRYTPDVMVRYKDKTFTVFEFKPESKLTPKSDDDKEYNKLIEKLSLYKQLITQKRGLHYRIASEDLYSPQIFVNHDYLWKYFRYPRSVVLCWLHEHTPNEHIRYFGEIDKVYAKPAQRTFVKACLAYGFGKINLEEAFETDSEILWSVK